MNFKDATVIGFFSLPPASLAEHNTEAYNQAMANAPVGAGTCANCGTGIRHHVIVLVEGVRRFIGTECALKVGGTVADGTRHYLTTSQLADKRAKEAVQNELWAKHQEHTRLRRAARSEAFSDVLQALGEHRTDFHQSLAEQLVNGPLSERQARFVCLAVLGRQTKRNEFIWDELFNKVTL